MDGRMLYECAGDDSSSLHSTRSLHSEDLSTVLENGRSYPNNTYFMPCDSKEQTRLAVLHRVYTSILNGDLSTVQPSSGKQRILDVGTGPGHWAMAMAQQYPCAEIIAVDAAVWDIEGVEEEARQALEEEGLQYEDMQDVTWEIDDLDIWGPSMAIRDSIEDDPLARSILNLNVNDKPQCMSTSASGGEIDPSYRSVHSHSRRSSSEAGWNFSEPFNFIHIRGMKGAFADWAAVYRECYKSLVPGGWLEVIDFKHHIVNTDSTMSRIYVATDTAAARSGYPLTTAHLREEFFQAASFENYSMKEEVLSSGVEVRGEPGEETKTLKKMWAVALVESLEATSLRLLTRYGGCSADEVREILAEVVDELLSGEDIMTTFCFVKAQKPLGATG